jgi:hypothetical protein
MEQDEDNSQAVILHEDKKYFPDAEEVRVLRFSIECLSSQTYSVCVCACALYI